jgi:hypothetical protein
VTNTNKLVNVLNALKAQKHRGRVTAGGKSGIMRRSLRAKEKESKMSQE